MKIHRWGWCVCFSLMFGMAVQAAMPKSAPNGEEVFRVNCGAVGWDYTDPQGNFWLQDEAYSKNNRWGYVNGAQYDEGAPTGTNIAPVYRTQRRGLNNLKYVVDLPNGDYQVTLHFIESVFAASGKRVFDVALEGTVVLNRLDIFSAAGGKGRAYSRTFPVTVTDKKLEVTFPALYQDYATLSGLEVKVQSVSDDAFLDFLQFKMYPYFLTEAGATTGLISDKSNGWADQDFDVASIATTGFGLSVLTVAAERGWITSAQARQRVHTILDLFTTMQKDPARSYHGFWYHFLTWNTAQPTWTYEVSTVDSALFILGALQAGEYFRAVDPTIAQKAETLYKNMEWDWFTRRVGGAPFLSMGWKSAREGGMIAAPDRGYFLPYQWDAYNESVFVNLLALGSPTHPANPEAWVKMRRHGAFTGGGVSEFMHFPPLFGHQYHNLYFDFKNKHDGTSDFWDAAVRATLRDRDQFAQNPLNEPDIWGLTACEVPGGGYEAFGTEPGGMDWGITAPTGPLGSIAMTPTESIASARKMFFQYKHAIWGRYGFVDSFSIADDTRADNTLGLDNGPIVLAIENYRTGLIWNTFTKSPFVAAALTKAGFVAAGDAPRIFSHSERNGNRAVFAQDGNPATGWESSVENNQWLAVDYGRPTALDRVRLSWGPTYAKQYEIQTSDDGTTWVTVATKANGTGGKDLVMFPHVTARLIRWVGQQRGGANSASQGYSLLEMRGESVSPPSKPWVVGRFPTQLTWQWEDHFTGETGYRVRRVSDNAILADNLPPNTVTWTQDNLKGNTAQQVKVEVYTETDSRTSDSSDVVFTDLAPPIDLAMNVVDGNPVLSWNGADNSASTVYLVYRTFDHVVFSEVYKGNEYTTGPLVLPANQDVDFGVFATDDQGDSSEAVYLTTRSVSGTLDPVTGIPNYESKAPPFTVGFAAAPTDPEAVIVLTSVRDIPGPPPSSWALVGSAWTAGVESVSPSPGLVLKARKVLNQESMVAKWNGESASWIPLEETGTGGEGGIFGVFDRPTSEAPSKPQVVGRLPTRLIWQWDDNSTGETGYRVRRVSDNAILADNLPPNTVTWTQDNLKGNTKHQVRVEVVREDGEVSSEASALVATPAAPPTDLTLGVVNGIPILSWNGADNSASTVYRAYRTTDRVVFTKVYSGKSLITGPLALPANRDVVFKVYAVTDEDELSDVVSLSTRTAVGTIDPQTGSPDFESKEPPFTVAFAVPPPVGSEQIVILDPLDVLPGPPSPLWRLMGSAWRAEVESDQEASSLMVKTRRVSGPDYVVAKWNEGSTSWDPLDASGSGGNGGVFAVFYLLPQPVSSSVDAARIFPNPFRPSRSMLKIDHIPAGSQVKLYTLLGEQVTDLPPATEQGETQWDGRNGAGHSVAPGVYWGMINGNGGKKMFRLAVE